jgi:hypothetical protein
MGRELLSLLILCSLEIVGPTQVEPGDLAVFRIKPASAVVAWDVIPRSVRDRFLEVSLPNGERALVFACARDVQVTIIAAGCVEGEVRLALHSFSNGSCPPNPPGPSPGPPPEPQPPTPPPPTPPFILLWIEESTERTAAQAAAQNDRIIRDALQRAGWTLRVVDKDVTDERGRRPPDLQPWIEKALKLGLPRLFVIDKNGRYLSYRAPANPQEFIRILAELKLQLDDTRVPPDTQSRVRMYSPQYVMPYCVGPVCVP